MQPKEEFEQTIQSIDQALGEIERTLEQMLTLAQLSASDLNVDREALQKTLERLQRKIDRYDLVPFFAVFCNNVALS